MLATTHHTRQTSPPHNFLPTIPSPLSPRRTNVFDPRPHRDTMAQHPSSTRQSSSHASFSPRPIKPIPTSQRSDALRERRRDMFLRKVRQERDDSKWNTRIDDMARLDYVNQMRRWEVDKTRSAPSTSYDLAEAEIEADIRGYAMETPYAPPLDLEVDAILRQESQEIEALLSLMESSELENGTRDDATTTAPTDDASTFGSDDDDDDEEYDSIFMDLIDESGGAVQEGQHQTVEDEMDLT